MIKLSNEVRVLSGIVWLDRAVFLQRITVFLGDILGNCMKVEQPWGIMKNIQKSNKAINILAIKGRIIILGSRATRRWKFLLLLLLWIRKCDMWKLDVINSEEKSPNNTLTQREQDYPLEWRFFDNFMNTNLFFMFLTFQCGDRHLTSYSDVKSHRKVLEY